MTESQVLSISVAMHMAKCDKMQYDQNHNGHNNWIAFKTWLLWRNHPKWMSPTSQAYQSTSSGAGFTRRAPATERKIPLTAATASAVERTLESDTRETESLHEFPLPVSLRGALGWGRRRRR